MSRVAHPAGPRHGDVLPADHPPAAPQDLNSCTRRSGRAAPAAIRRGRSPWAAWTCATWPPSSAPRCTSCDEDDFRGALPRVRRRRSARTARRATTRARRSCCTAIARWVREEGLDLDVCTGGELAVALRAGFPPERIALHGNNKSSAELARGVEARRRPHRRSTPSTRSPGSAAVAEEPGGAAARCWSGSPSGVEAHTHEFIATAHEDQKFGFSLAAGHAAEAVRRVVALPGLELRRAALAHRLADLRHRRLRGGRAPRGRRCAGQIARRARRRARRARPRRRPRHRLHRRGRRPRASRSSPTACARSSTGVRGRRAAGAAAAVEPGRAIAGPAPSRSTRSARSRTSSTGLRTYVSVDGGMSDNIRTALYDADYTVRAGHRAHRDAAPCSCRVVGKHCESGDIVVRDAWLPADLAPGDLLAVAATGAYCRSLASNYNHVPRPPVVAVRDGAARVIVRRETVDDLLSARLRMNHDRCPPCKVALLGCGVVGTEVVRLLHEQADDLTAAHRRAGSSWPGSRSARLGHRRVRDDRPARCSPPTPSALVTRRRRRHRGRGHRRHRAGPHADPRRAEGRQAGGHREQGAARRRRRGRCTRPRRAGVDLYYEAVGRRGDPADAPAARVAGRRPIRRVLGIVNGTTNFILYRMDDTGAGFAEALAEAQALGYAEADPTADVEGFDAAAKAAILAGARVPHPGDRRRRVPRGHHRGHRDRHRPRRRDRLRGQAARDLRARCDGGGRRSACTRR